MSEPQNSTVRLTDKPSILIVEQHQRKLGDATTGRTLVRIIQAFHSSGLSLTPETPSPAEAGH